MLMTCVCVSFLRRVKVSTACMHARVQIDTDMKTPVSVADSWWRNVCIDMKKK